MYVSSLLPIYINTDILTTKPMLAHFLFNLLILDYRQKWMKLHGLQKKRNYKTETFTCIGKKKFINLILEDIKNIDHCSTSH